MHSCQQLVKADSDRHLCGFSGNSQAGTLQMYVLSGLGSASVDYSAHRARPLQQVKPPLGSTHGHDLEQVLVTQLSSIGKCYLPIAPSLE